MASTVLAKDEDGVWMRRGPTATTRIPVSTTPFSQAAGLAFTPAELDERIEWHTRRIARECPKGQRPSIQAVLDYLGEK